MSRSRLWFFVVVVGAAYTIPHGYQVAVVNEPELILREWVNETTSYRYGPRQVITIWSFVVSCRLIGTIVGNLLVPVLMEKLGRRKTLIIMSFFLVIGDVLSFSAYFAGTFILMIIGRLFTGMTTGGCLNAFTVYTTEIAPAELRGRISITGMVFRSVGMIVAAIAGLPMVLGTKQYWPYLFLLPAVVSLGGPLFLLFCPESPRWLYITRGDIEGALASLRFYNGDDMDISSIVADLEKASAQYKQRIRIRDVLAERAYWKPLLLSIVFGIVFAAGGRAVVMNYSTSLITTAAVPVESAIYVTMASYCLPLPITLLMLPMVDRFGRKTLLTAICAIIIVIQCVLFVSFRLIQTGNGNATALKWTVVVATALWVPAVVGGLMSLQFIPSELFPQNARSAGYAIHIITTFAAGAVSTQAFQPLEHMSRGFGIIFLLVPMVVFAMLLLKLLPETKNLSIEAVVASNEVESMKAVLIDHEEAAKASNCATRNSLSRKGATCPLQDTESLSL